MTLNGQLSQSFLTVGSSNRRPINRLQPRISSQILNAEQIHKDLLDIEDGVSWVHGSLVLRRLTDQALLVGEGHETRLSVGGELAITSSRADLRLLFPRYASRADVTKRKRFERLQEEFLLRHSGIGRKGLSGYVQL